MNAVFVLLSPTFGMHQYTADLANRVADGSVPAGADEVTVVTTTHAPRSAYAPQVRLVTPLSATSTGFRREGLDVRQYRRTLATIVGLAPAFVHFTGVHLWNAGLVYALRRRGIPVVHTLHDLDPHRGVGHAGLIRLWNRLIIGSGAHILVHGRVYRERLVGGHPSTALRSAQDASAGERAAHPSTALRSAQDACERVTYAPLLHGFWSYEAGRELAQEGGQTAARCSENIVLFFGRVEEYKGVDTLLDAWGRLQYNAGVSSVNGDSRGDAPPARLIVAGAVAPALTETVSHLPAGVELRNQRIDDAEAMALFRSAALLVLPYHDATQSALIAAAYTFGVPVIVTQSGALPEYVTPGVTGWIVPPADAGALAETLGRALQRLAGGGRDVMRAATRVWYAEQRRAEADALAGMYLSLAP